MGIKRAVKNDINDLVANPEKKTEKRVARFVSWFTRIFDSWYDDVTEASENGKRKCLTDNFPYNSPGNLDKESVFVRLFCFLKLI